MNVVLSVLAVVGLVVLVESFRQGLYTGPIVFAGIFVGLYVWAWWVRRGARRER